jgi:hypothetical protein
MNYEMTDIPQQPSLYRPQSHPVDYSRMLARSPVFLVTLFLAVVRTLVQQNRTWTHCTRPLAPLGGLDNLPGLSSNRYPQSCVVLTNPCSISLNAFLFSRQCICGHLMVRYHPSTGNHHKPSPRPPYQLPHSAWHSPRHPLSTHNLVRRCRRRSQHLRTCFVAKGPLSRLANNLHRRRHMDCPLGF